MIKVINGQSLSLVVWLYRKPFALHCINTLRDSLTGLLSGVFNDFMSEFYNIVLIKITLLNSI